MKSKMKTNTQNRKTPVIFLYTPVILCLYFNTSYADPFNAAKFSLLMILTSLIFGPMLDAYRLENYRVIRSEKVFLISIGTFILSMFLVAIFSKYKLIAFLGESQRKNGFITYLCLAIILIYVSRKIEFTNILSLYRIIQILTFSLCIYGFAQHFGYDFVKWNNPHNAIILTQGNPNFASSCLGMLASISLLLIFLDTSSITWKLVSVINSISSVLLMIWSGSRQGLIVFLFSIGFYIVIYFIKHKPKYKHIISLVSIGSILLVILGMLQKGPLSEIIYKGSLSARGYYWRSGIEMFKDNLITGVGLDRFAYFFKQYREIGYVNTYGYDINTSDAHSVFIQLFSTGGLFVGLSYLFFTLAVFVLGIKSLQKLEDQEFKILLVAISGWLGYQSQSLISINNIGTAIWGWYLSGIIIGLSILVKKKTNVADNKSMKISVKSKNLNVYPVLVSILVLVPTLILSVLINRSEHAVFMNRGYSEINPAPQFSSVAIASSNTVISNPISENYYKLSAGRVLVNFSKFEEGFKAIENLIDTDPNIQAALEYMASARTFDGSYTQARKYRLQIMKIDPFNAPNLLSLVEVNLKLGNLSEAQDISGRLAAIFPNSEQSIKSQELLKTLQ